MGKPGMMFYFDIRPCLKRLNYEEKGKLFDAMLDYSELGIEPQLDGMSGVAWDFLRPGLDRDTDRYEQTILKRRYAVFARESKKKQEEIPSFGEWLRASYQNASHDDFDEHTASHDIQLTTNNLQPTTYNIQSTNANTGEPAATRPVFSPPSKEELTVYCREMGYSMDTDSFLDYYSANGWMIGKSPMKDWKAAVRRWQRKENGNGAGEKLSGWTVGEVL